MVGTRVRQSVMFAHLVPPQRATDPSPVPLRLVKAPVAGRPLPKGDGKDSIPCVAFCLLPSAYCLRLTVRLPVGFTRSRK